MRARLALIAAALALLIVAGTRHVEHPTSAWQATPGAPGRLAAQPAPAPAWPTVLGAGATVSITLQTAVDVAWSRPHRPTSGAFGARLVAQVDRARRTPHRNLPLLI